MKKFFRHQIRLTMVALPFVFLLLGCGNGDNQPPVSKEKMVAVLTDIHQVQAITTQERLPDNERREYYYCNILEKYELTEAEFDSAVSWYMRHMDLYVQIYEEVIQRMEARRDSVAIMIAAQAGLDNPSPQ